MASPHVLCARCTALDFEKLSEPCIGRYGSLRRSRIQLHQPSFEDLVLSAKSCVLCAHFLRTWVSCPSHWQDADKSDEEREKTTHMLERDRDMTYQDSKKALRKLHREKDWPESDEALSWPYEVRANEWPPPGLDKMLGFFTVRGAIVEGMDGANGLYGLTLSRIELFDNKLWLNNMGDNNWTNISCLTDDVDASWIAGRPLGAESVQSLGRKWLSECSKNHTSCAPTKDTEMPTRVIDVGIEGGVEPRLLETNGRQGQWVAMSYPWGGAKPITTRDTYKGNLQELPMASLPPLFQDVIRVVRDMGFQYLWIDSICIVQGDLEDWAKECGRMAGVYKDSAFTIAACAASNPNNSLKTPTDQIDRSPCAFDKNGIRFVASLDRIIEYGDVSMPTERNSVIATRGWCFQERLLSPRIFYMGSRQLYWECHTCQFFEFSRVPFALTGKKPYLTQADVTHVISKSIFGLQEPFQISSWPDLVDSYSRCNLTSTMDKLPALSGIAQAAASITRDTYLAGLWLSQLHCHLAWFCTPSQRKTQDVAAEYRAPSWSWACIDGPVQFQSPTDNASFEPAFETLGATTTLATSDTFGRVSAGVLTVSGHILELELTPTMRIPSRENYDEENKQIIVDYWPDYDIDKHARKLPCLLLGGSYHFAALALEPVQGQPNTFRRAGFVYSSAYLYTWRVVEWLRENRLKRWLKRKRQTIVLI
jgi:hypothetical protein